MARYNGPKTKISRIFGEPILGNGKWLGKNSNPPGQHGAQRKRKTLGEYALQLREKQKAKYTYGVLEKQFRKTFEEASRRKGVTGENLIKLLEARLDNAVFRMGIAPSRPFHLPAGKLGMVRALLFLPLDGSGDRVLLRNLPAALQPVVGVRAARRGADTEAR